MKKLEIRQTAPSWLPFLAILLSFLLLGTFTLFSQDRLKDEELDKELKILIDEQVSKYNLTGISLGFQVPDEEPWLVSAGYSNPITKEELSPDRTFNIASYTKTIIATLTFMLIEEGLLSIDDPLNKWISTNYENINNGITVRQLLNHTSGVNNYTDHQDYAGRLAEKLDRIWTEDELLKAFVKSTTLHPGERCAYSNTNYLLLGMILQEASELDISVLLKNKIFEPLGMINSCYPMEDPLPWNRVEGWEDTDGDNELNNMSNFEQSSMWSMIRTCSGIFSDTYDMNTFMNALFVDKNLVSQQSLNEMLQLAVPNGKYGHGLERYVSSELVGWGHFGGYIGFSSAIFYFPERGFNITVLINQRPVEQREEIVDEILARVLELIITSTDLVANPIANFSLSQNYPNPFADHTEFGFDLMQNGKVSLRIYNTSGQLIKTIAEGEEFNQGHHTFQWDGTTDNGREVIPDIYLYQIETSEGTEIKRCLKIK